MERFCLNLKYRTNPNFLAQINQGTRFDYLVCSPVSSLCAVNHVRHLDDTPSRSSSSLSDWQNVFKQEHRRQQLSTPYTPRGNQGIFYPMSHKGRTVDVRLSGVQQRDSVCMCVCVCVCARVCVCICVYKRRNGEYFFLLRGDLKILDI